MDAQALFEHPDCVLDPTLVESDGRECTQRARFNPLVVRGACPAQVVVVQRPLAV
jgi:hypothetical protein